MKNYVLIDNVKDQIINTFLLITSVDDFYYDLDQVLSELSAVYGPEFTIVLDHFITNGFSFNRFVRIDYNNEKYKKTLITSSEINDFYDNKFIEYLRKHKDFLNESSLSKRTISIIRNDIVRA
ncbi:MAG: type II toxin-antitoxin system RnlB family antitoxin [Acholeplasmataceae bacterium]|jgi:hypothetical protein|nr:type II toxin-antitoxin system RnlB family antitoxin [Acholeplasmataceae bacterium]